MDKLITINGTTMTIGTLATILVVHSVAMGVVLVIGALLVRYLNSKKVSE